MMKNRQLHTIILPLCTLLLFSCTQDNISPASDTENEIRFQTGTPTRGLIDNLAQEGTKITLYGYHDGNFLAANNDAKILNGKSLKCLDNNGNWSVVDGSDNPLTYFWEGTGNYRFFGWLQQDASGLTFPSTLSFQDKTLSVPVTFNYSYIENNGTIKKTESYNQFDFLYSNVDERELTDANMANEKGRPVAMNMKHLFSAFSIGIQNTSEDDITVKSIKLQRLHSTGTATIDFSSATNVAYNTSSTGQPLASYQDDKGYLLQGTNSVAGGTKVPNIFNPEDVNQKFYMVWPQAENIIFDNRLEGKTAEEEAKLDETYDECYPLIMEYTINTETTPRKKRMKFPKQVWQPGMKYSFNVLIADKIITLYANVQPWDYSSSNINFSDGTVEVNGNNSLTWDKTKCRVEPSEKKVYVQNGNPVEATFALAAPVGGSWIVSFRDDGGNIDQFEIIDDADKATDGIGPIDGNIHRIKIKPINNDTHSDFEVRLKFAVKTADGRTIPIDDVIQVAKDANGTIIKNDDGKPITEIYTIVSKATN